MAVPVGALVRGREIYFVRPEMTVRDAVRYMAEKSVGAAVVLDGERVIGIFTERDLMTRVVHLGKDVDSTKVVDAMSRDLILSEADESEETCHRRMIRHRIRHLPVVEKGHLIGLVSLRDLLLETLHRKEEELDQMTQYIHYIPPHAASEKREG
ncbi:MAG: CBS domain-containing protein [bacterium]